MSGRGERLLWKIMEFFRYAAGVGWIPPPPELFARMQLADAGQPSRAEAEPVIDPTELDDWLDSVLGAEPDSD